MNRIIKAIKKMDVFSKSVNLNFLREDKHRTPIGYFLTIFLIGFTIVSGIYFG
jgi:hypothetical protein